MQSASYCVLNFALDSKFHDLFEIVPNKVSSVSADIYAYYYHVRYMKSSMENAFSIALRIKTTDVRLMKTIQVAHLA